MSTTKAKKLIIIIFSFVFAFSFSKSPVNRAIAQDSVLICEYCHDEIDIETTNGIVQSSPNGEVTLRTVGESAVIAKALSGSDYFIKTIKIGNVLAIFLPDEVATATIEITACAYVDYKDVSVDIIKDGRSVIPEGAVSLLGTHAVVGEPGWYEYSYSPKTFSVTVSGGGEYYISCESDSGFVAVYFGSIKISASVQQEIPFVTECELLQSGYLPETKSTFISSGLNYTHLGWVDENYSIVDETAILPAGKYYAVYASLEEKGASILMDIPTGIKLGYKVNFFDNRYIEPLILNGGLKFFGEFALEGQPKSALQELTIYRIVDRVLNLDICINDVPSDYYKTGVSSQLTVQFGKNGDALKSENLAPISVFYVANYFYNDLSETYSEEYQYNVWVDINGEKLIRYSRYADPQREVFKTIIDDANNLK